MYTVRDAILFIIYNRKMADACVGQLGEVEQKMVALVEGVFGKYDSVTDDEGNQCVTKAHIRDFIKEAMAEASESEAWDELEFEECY